MTIADTGQARLLLPLAGRHPPRTHIRRIPRLLELLGRVPMPGRRPRHRTCRTPMLHRPLLHHNILNPPMDNSILNLPMDSILSPLLDNSIPNTPTDNMRLTLSTLTRQ